MAVTSLIELLTNPDTFNVGINYGGNVGIVPNRNLSYGGPSKSIKYGGRPGETEAPSYHLVPRVEWKYNDENANPTFLDGGKKSHYDDPFPDFMFRGSFGTYKDRLRLDIKRLTNFFFGGHGRGAQFILRQGALQLLNPQVSEKVYNLGVNTLLSIAGSGLVSIKRAGLLPKIVGNKADNAGLEGLLNLGDSPVADFLSSDGYLGLKGAKAVSDSQNRYGLGDPGRGEAASFFSVENILGVNPFDTGPPAYNATIPEHKRDKVSLQGIIYKRPGEYGDLDMGMADIDDFVPFRFEVLNSNNVNHSKIIVFRAYLNVFGDQYASTHNSIQMNGRGETFYTYNNFSRKINIGFKIAAKSRAEMKPLYQKLNYLAAQTAPNYSKFGRIRTPYMRLTVGDYLKRVPGIVNSVNINWQKEYPWEIRLDPKELDKDMKILPQVLDVTFNFTPIHDFVPENKVTTPFIGLNKLDPSDANWVPVDEDYTDIDYGEEMFSDEEEEEETSSTTYTVKPGDTLSGIASKHNISRWQDIAEANQIQGDAIQAGQELIIPSTTS